MIALLAGFVFAPQPAGIIGWLPALLYTATAGLDFLDGYWARRHNTATRMGAVLDQEYDALGILVAAVLVVQWGRLPAAFLYLGAAKYLFSWGIGWRRLRGRPVYPLPPSRLRRRLAGFQMGILAVFLWPIARPPGTVLAELIIGIPLLLGFIRDWMLVSGAFDPEDQTYRKLKTAFHRIAETWLPLLLRAVLAAAAATTAAAVIGQAAAPASWIPAGVAQAGLLMTAYPGLRLALLALLVAGCFTSSVSMLLLLLEGLRIFITRLDPWAAAVVSATLLLFFSGPGPYRLALRRSARPAPGLVKR
jgi:phosphatidylglycerophosphate synthase